MSRPENSSERVTREDLVTFVNACFACTGQREFYSDAAGQSVAIDFLHRYILGNYRRLYAQTLAAGVNHFNQALIAFNLLATGRKTKPGNREEENRLIREALRRLPPQRVFRLFEKLRDQRVNNRRTRAVVRDYLRWRPDPEFDAVKYRSRVRVAVAHAHLRLPQETHNFLFGAWKQREFATPLFETFRKAHYAQEEIYNLPYTVAEGFAARHGVSRGEFLQKISKQMTAGEKLRMQSASSTKISLDLKRAPLTRLALYISSLSARERLQRQEELHDALDGSAARAYRRSPYQLGRVAAILDRSYSSTGSSEKLRRPLAVALAANRLLSHAAAAYQAFWTPQWDGQGVVPRALGQTNLADPLLDALEWRADLVVIVSDGFENDPPGVSHALLRAYRRYLDHKGRTSVVHLNPVFDADNYAPKTLGPGIPTVGLRDAEDLLTALSFARFAEGSAALADLERYFVTRMKVLFGGSDAQAR